MESSVRNAIARIDIVDGGKNISRGTGCLVADRLVLTALHVVANRFENPPQPYPGTITLTFPGLKVEATLHDAYHDPQGDWAILKCKEPVPIRPLPLADLRESGGEFVTYGFPDSQPVDGMIQTGTVENHLGELNGVHAFQLFSKQAAAGDGAPVKGLSGAPMLVDDAVVGVLRFALMKDGAAVAGTLYACPISGIAERCSDFLPMPDPCWGLPGLPRRDLPIKPFRYLQYFTENEAELFFGRNREIKSFYEDITNEDAAPINLLYGQSGVGKSSFLASGLLPRLKWNYEILYIRRDDKETLLRTIQKAVIHLRTSHAIAGEEAHETIGIPLRVEWRRAEVAIGKPLILLIDQVEEVFTRPNSDCPTELAEFVGALKEIFSVDNQKLKGRVVLAFRKEWYPEIQKAFESKNLGFDKVFLEALDREAVVEIVTGLLSCVRLEKRYGLRIDPAVPNLIATDLRSDPGSPTAPALQILLTKMWEKATERSESSPVFSVDLYREMRKQGLLLDDFIDRQLEQLSATYPSQVASGLILDILVHHTTPLMTAAECTDAALSETYRNHAGELGGVLQACKNLYLLVDSEKDRKSEAKVTRLAHDTLALPIRHKFDESDLPGPRAWRILKNRAAEWRDENQGATLDAADLAIVEQGVIGLGSLLPHEERLLDASIEERQRQNRVRRMLHSGLMVAVVALILSVVWAILEKREADTQRKAAETQREEAETQKGIAVEQTKVAKKREQEARDEKARAVEALAEAERQKGIAEEQKKVAEQRETEANDEKAKAVEALAEAERQKGIAEEQKKVAEQREKEANDERANAVEALAEAERQKGIAEDQKKVALQREKEAEEERAKAVEALAEAERQKAIAEEQKKVAEQREKEVKIALAETEKEKAKAEQALAAAEEANRIADRERKVALAAKNVADSEREKAELAKKEAEFQNDKATLRKDAAETDVLLSQDPVQGLVNAIGLVNRSKEHFGNVPTGFQRRLHKAVETAREQSRINTGVGAIRSISISSKGDIVVCGDKTGFFCHIRGNGTKTKYVLDDPEANIFSVATSPNGEVVASSTSAGFILWDNSGTELWRKENVYFRHSKSENPEGRHNENFMGIRSVGFGDNGNIVMGGDLYGKVYRFNLDGHLIGTTPPLDREDMPRNYDIRRKRLFYSPDFRKLVVTHTDGKLGIRDIDKGLSTNEINHDTSVEHVTIDPNGSRFASVGYDRTIRIWDFAGNPVVKKKFQYNEDDIKALIFNSGGNGMICGGDGRVLEFINFAGDKIASDFTGTDNEVTALAYGEGAGILTVGQSDGTVRILDPRGPLVYDPIATHSAAVTALAYDSDGMSFYSTGFDKTVRKWDALTGALDWEASWADQTDPNDPNAKWGEISTTLVVRRDPDTSAHVVTAVSGIGNVRSYDSRTGVAIGGRTQKLGEYPEGGVSGFVVSPSGRMVAGGSTKSGIVFVWSLHNLKCRKVTIGQPARVIGFRGDEDKIALRLTEEKGVTGFWDFSGNPIGQQFSVGDEFLPTDGKKTLAISPVGNVLIAATAQGYIHLWESKSGKLSAEKTKAHSGEILSVVFSPNGEKICSVSKDGSVRLWDSKLQPIALPFDTGDNSTFFTAAFSPNSQSLLTADIAMSADKKLVGRLQHWQADWRAWLKTACARVKDHTVFNSDENKFAREVCEQCLWDEDPAADSGANAEHLPPKTPKTGSAVERESRKSEKAARIAARERKKAEKAKKAAERRRRKAERSALVEPRRLSRENAINQHDTAATSEVTNHLDIGDEVAKIRDRLYSMSKGGEGRWAAKLSPSLITDLENAVNKGDPVASRKVKAEFEMVKEIADIELRLDKLSGIGAGATAVMFELKMNKDNKLDKATIENFKNLLDGMEKNAKK